jgi:hypothetical protein
MRILTTLIAFLVLSLPTQAAEGQGEAPKISFGNGSQNWIVVKGTTREGATLTFPEVVIDGNGWLVLHPFKDGKPVGEIYSGATYITSGKNTGVAVEIDKVPETGEMFLVMLHRDVNENQKFDFIFIDDRNVIDRAVFEGMTMIAHAIPAP